MDDEGLQDFQKLEVQIKGTLEDDLEKDVKTKLLELRMMVDGTWEREIHQQF